MNSAQPRRVTAFTLIEVLVASAIVIVLAVMLVQTTEVVADNFRRTSTKIEQFTEARQGYEAMTRRIAEATLNTYWEYFDRNNQPPSADPKLREKFVPDHYGRYADLRFRSGSMAALVPDEKVERPTHGIFFQAPAGEVQDPARRRQLDLALNTWGYFLEIGEDRAWVPAPLRDLVPARRRCRLLELRQPTERMNLYWPPVIAPGQVPTPAQSHWWFHGAVTAAADRPVRVLAENVIALVLQPRLALAEERLRQGRFGRDSDKALLAPTFDYDSTRASNHQPPLVPPDPEVNPRHQLPPVVQVTMVALDELSARRLVESPAGVAPGAKNFGLPLDDLFRKATRLEDNPATPTPGDGDLATLEGRLIERGLTYRVFNSNVIIRGAKWSRSQIN